jgi:dihydrolipoamide dehydrogenase
LIARDAFGGMAANDGPVPVRTLAHAGRLMRDARQLNEYGITTSEPVLDYPRLLARVGQIVDDVRLHSSLRQQIDAAGVTVCEHASAARFVDPHTIEIRDGTRLRADRIILCTGGVNRPLPVPGFEFTCTHSNAWALTSVPSSMLIIGAGATGAQVASIFNAIGSKVQLFEAGPRILSTEDEDVSAAAAQAFRSSGITVNESFGAIDSFEKTPTGVRMNYSKDGKRLSVEADLAVVAIGWVAETGQLNLAAAGVELTERKFVRVDDYMRTSASHIFAAGDITGQLMLVPQALRAGFVAASNAVSGPILPIGDQTGPIGSFTEPEYAQVGLTESKARSGHDILTTVVKFDSTTRTVIDGHTFGFCKLITDRKTAKILGCHIIGERAVDIAEVAAIAMAAGMRVGDLANIPLAYPTYAAVLVRAATNAAHQLGFDIGWQAHELDAPQLNAEPPKRVRVVA